MTIIGDDHERGANQRNGVDPIVRYEHLLFFVLIEDDKATSADRCSLRLIQRFLEGALAVRRRLAGRSLEGFEKWFEIVALTRSWKSDTAFGIDQANVEQMRKQPWPPPVLNPGEDIGSSDHGINDENRRTVIVLRAIGKAELRSHSVRFLVAHRCNSLVGVGVGIGDVKSEPGAPCVAALVMLVFTIVSAAEEKRHWDAVAIRSSAIRKNRKDTRVGAVDRFPEAI